MALKLYVVQADAAHVYDSPKFLGKSRKSGSLYEQRLNFISIEYGEHQMDPVEVLERLGALTAGLTPTSGTATSDLHLLRRLLARDLQTPKARERTLEAMATLIDRRDLETLDDKTRRALEQAVAESALAEAAAELPLGTRISRRNVPLRSSAVPGSVPPFAAGRAVDRTLGPFIDFDGRLVWFDIFWPVHQVSLVRTPASAPFVTLPLRGLILASTTEYAIPAGSVWLLANQFGAAAPAGGYCGVRISGGRLTLSVAPTISGTTLSIAAGTKAVLTLKLAPLASAAAGPEPGADAFETEIALPSEVTMEFTAAGGALTGAKDAQLKVFGTGVTLTRAAAPAGYEPRLNRLVFPFTPAPSVLASVSSRSKLFALEGEAPIVGGSWALAVAISAPDDLGNAAGAGALALNLRAGLRGGWKGLAGGPAQLGPALVMAETDRVALVAAEATAPGVRHRMALWTAAATSAAPKAAEFGFDRFLLRYESLAGSADVVLTNGSVTASTDRPVTADGQPVPIRAATSTTVIWQDAGTVQILAVAVPEPWAAPANRAIALKNGLVRVPPPLLFALAGELARPDQVVNANLVLVFRIGQVMLSLPDPYVTSQPLPARFHDVKAGAAAGVGPLLISLVQWAQPDTSRLRLHLFFPPAPATGQVTGGVAQPLANQAMMFASNGPEGVGSTAPMAYYSVASSDSVDIDAAKLPNPAQARKEDLAALAGLRRIFEEASGSVRESVALLDVSSRVDHLGVTWGLERNRKTATAGGSVVYPLAIEDLAFVTPGRNARLLLLPQFQWEPLRNVPNPNIGFFPDRLVSADDGGASLFGSNTIRLVPILPDRLLEGLVEEFKKETHDIGVAFTLPFGIRAAAHLAPRRGLATKWAGFVLNRPEAPDAAFKGAYQVSVTAHALVTGPTVETPSLTGAAWQTRNAVDPATGAPNGFSALRGDILNEGVEAFFNNDFGPGEASRRVPVSRIDFAGLGASSFSEWFNPNAVAQISQVRFNAFVGRTAYEVVQVASVLYPWAVPVVRTVTMERVKEALVMRADSGWVATGPGLYLYPQPDPGLPPSEAPPSDWSRIETHPGVIRGVHNVRRIRETGRVVSRTIAGIEIELIEVRFDADVDIEGVVRGQIDGTTRVPSLDQVGFVQRLPKGYPLVPDHLAQILVDEGPLGGPVDCEIEVAGSGQSMHVVWADVDAAKPLGGGVVEFAAAARGSLGLPEDGAWSVVRRPAESEEYAPVDRVAGTPLIRQGSAWVPGSAVPWYRFADPSDLLREASPQAEFAIMQSSDGHQFLLPRPRIQSGTTAIATTERALLADAYARSTAAGIFPKATACFRSPAPLTLGITPQGRYKLGPSPTAAFNNIATAEREIVDADALAIRTRYAGPIRFMLDPDDPEVWKVEIDQITTSMDLGPFDDLMGVAHDFRVSNGSAPRLINPTPQYAPFLAPVVEIVKFLTDLLGIDDSFDVAAIQSSFKFQATAKYPIKGPNDGYFDFGAMKIKGELQAGFGWSEKDRWFGFVKIDLGMKVPALPPIFADGKTSIKLKGTELTGQEVTIRLIWGVALEAKLGPLGVSAEFNFGIEVIVAESGAWQIGLLVQIVGKAEILIVMVAVKIELLAAIGRLPPPTEKVEAIGKAKFAAEVSICWFLTISVEYSIEYREQLDI